MISINLPYGQYTTPLSIPQTRLQAVLEPSITDTASADGATLIKEALRRPIESEQLSKLAANKKNVVVITSDHTRPVPSHLTIPMMLEEIRQASPDADVTILIATGCHRAPTRQELEQKFGKAFVAKEKIIAHDCDTSETVELERLPSGGRLVLNKLIIDADLLVSDGFVEPHFFAGYSGGRKAVLPGVAARETVLYNHNGAFIDSPFARTGVLENNPLHLDMMHACRVAKLAFICNVVLDKEKRILYAAAGNADAAHRKACAYVAKRFEVDAQPADIVVTTNGGYPLDQNIYQAVKGMTAAEATVNKNGVIIMLAKSEDGHGGQGFYDIFNGQTDYQAMYDSFAQTPADHTKIDQWQAQVLARVLAHAKVVYVSDAPPDVVRNFGFTPAATIDEAIQLADKMIGRKDAKITVIPDGVGIIIRKKV